MANVSDIIEQFILHYIGSDSAVELSRRELADHFSCAPSQINYVLSTRFTAERGYVVESRRGGGGCIKVYRLTQTDDTLPRIQKLCGDALTEAQASYLLEQLTRMGYISDETRLLLATAISDKALKREDAQANNVRADIVKEVLLRLCR